MASFTRSDAPPEHPESNFSYSLYSVSTTAAVFSAWYDVDSSTTVKKARAASLTTYFILYLGLLVGFGVRLKKWDNNVPGHCYNTALLARQKDGHPYVDNIYLGLTGFFTTALAFLALEQAFETEDAPERLARQTEIPLGYACIQYPLHLYSVVAIRISNQRLLEGDSENTMGFGQLVAMVMLTSILAGCVLAIAGESFVSFRGTLL